ncbi:hypothetical protein Q7C20_21850, partial [Pseudomonas sp. AMR01]
SRPEWLNQERCFFLEQIAILQTKWRSKMYGDPNVGAGLLAKAVCQLMDELADPPPSRASPLPQF